MRPMNDGDPAREVDSRSRPSARRRRKLWELDDRFHCPAIGTCLTLEELRRIADKAGISVGTRMSDFELHHSFVQVAGNPLYASRLMQKWLDRKFEAVLKRFALCRSSDELAAQWERAAAAGEIAGPFWALITHPAADAALLSRVYGEVHMYSHLAGAGNRAALARGEVLARRCAELEEQLAWTAAGTNCRLRAQEQAIARLEGDLAQARGAIAELDGLRARLARHEGGAVLAELRGLCEAAEANRDRERERAEVAERELARIRTELERRTHECRALETQLEALLAQPCGLPEAGGEPCPALNLCGRRILYVGGRGRLAPRFRALVERCRGQFLYHDGGLEDGRARLVGALQQADAVLCPVDCVSHDACLRVKKFCKQNAKTFVPLRAASLSAFIAGLHEVAA